MIFENDDFDGQVDRCRIYVISHGEGLPQAAMVNYGGLKKMVWSFLSRRLPSDLSWSTIEVSDTCTTCRTHSRMFDACKHPPVISQNWTASDAFRDHGESYTTFPL